MMALSEELGDEALGKVEWEGASGGSSRILWNWNCQLCMEASYSCSGGTVQPPASNMQQSLVLLQTKLPITDLTTVVTGPITHTLIRLNRTKVSLRV